uniref:non-specific serine/threonine protein kinase n=1 Tax=Electrophorus electricus TaxID=8005 RepID=A0A4W4G4B4_ELEEL
MSLALNELLICCRGIEHERATERKKEVERLKRLIRDPETARELDRASSCRAPRQLTWDAVFRFLRKYLQKETELLQAGRANVSASTHTSRQKKAQDLSSLVKYFIRCANKRGPKLKCADLLSHVEDVLRSSFTCAAYGEDCSSTLLKDVLSVHKYWSEITSQQWESLLDVYCGLFNKASRSINRVLLSRIIHAVVQGCCRQTDGLSHTLFTFFCRALSNTRVEKQLAVVQHLISALNVFLRSVATNSRRRVCRLGEELLPSILYVWSQMRPNSTLKQEMVEFFNLQVCVHHPKGARTPETGALAEDWGKWHSHLYSLYDELVAEISHISSRGKYATGSRHIAARENLIMLTADVCHQLFCQDLRVEVQDTHSGSPQGRKRRRVELGWDVLRDRLQPQLSDFDMIPWLQVTAALISKYPDMLAAHELPPLLSLLYQLLGEQRCHGERGPYVLRCLRQVALCQVACSGKSQAGLVELGRLWGRVWVLALRGVSSAQTEALCLELLATMVQGSLVPMDREFWKLFSGAVCKPSIASALCLAQAMCRSSLPQAVYSREPCSSSPSVLGEADGPAGLREGIIDWFLTKEQSDDMDDSTRHHPVISSDFPLNLVPRILVALMLKDSVSGLLYLKGSPVLDPSGVLTEVQALYLQFSFDDTVSGSSAAEDRSDACWEKPQLTVIGPLRRRLEQGLQDVASHLLNSPPGVSGGECYFSEEEFSRSECSVSPTHMLRGLTLLTGVLGAFVTVRLLTEEDACQNPLFQKAKALAQDFSDYVSSCRTRLLETHVLSLLKSVMLHCSQHVSLEEKDSVSTVSRGLLMKAFPARLLNELSDMCKVMLSSSGKGDGEVGEDQPEEDTQLTRTHVDNQPEEVDLFDDGDGAHPSSSGTQKSNAEDSQHALTQSPLSEDHLDEQDLAFLSVLRFLSLCVCVDQDRGLAFRVLDVRRRVLKLLDLLDGTKPLHLHMYLILLKELPAEEACLTAEEYCVLLRPLADACSLYRQDQEVCASILMALLPCIHSLGRQQRPPEGSEEMDNVKGMLLKVVSGFCILGKSGRCSSAVRSALGHCLRALLEADPCCKWAVLSLMEEELPVCVVLPSLLADPHHYVRMLAVRTVERLFLEKPVKGGEKKQLLPLKHQQMAFENIYLKAQEGMSTQRGMAPEDLPDETSNRRATLLKSLSVVMCCSPVCEKQALFALIQSHKENAIEEPLLKKVLAAVSCALGYRTPQLFVHSHLYYLVAEWLAQKQTDPGYTLQAFPHSLLGCSGLEDFYRSSYRVLIPHLVFLNDFEEVKSIGTHLGRDWRRLLADCFPRIMVHILPHFALPQDDHAADRREQAHHVYDLLKEDTCLGKQQIDSLICGNLADIVVELLMTLYEGGASGHAEAADLPSFTGELDPAPNPPFFTSHVIKATLVYLSRCHSTSQRSLVSILSKTPMSIQKILFCLSQREGDTTNAYERHRILMMYQLFVKLLLPEVKDGLGGAWAFVLRDVIYTLIHHINSRSLLQDEVSVRSLALCCDLLTTVCQTAVRFCDDALESHLQVIVGTLTAQVSEQSAISQQALRLLKFLVVDNPDTPYLRRSVPFLEPFPDQPAFSELRTAQRALKYCSRVFTLKQEIEHFLSVKSCDSLPLTRLEGLKDLKGQLCAHKEQTKQLLKECHADPSGSVLVWMVVNLLQLCKLAANHPGGRDIQEAVGSCLGELGPLDLSTIALHHGKDQIYSQAAALYPDAPSQWVFIILSCMNNALTHHSITVRQAAAVCLKDVLAIQSGLEFWEKHKLRQDPMLLYLSTFRTTKRKASVCSPMVRQLDSADLWSVQAGEQRDWLHNLCRALLQSGAVQSEALLTTGPLCEVKTDFCQTILPLFFHDVLLRDSGGAWRKLLSTHVQRFLRGYCARPATPTTTFSVGEADVGTLNQPDKWSLRTMLAVIDYLRAQPRPLSPSSSECGTVCESNFWLELTYLDVARAAQVCSGHFTALLYCEIYVDNMSTAREATRRAQSRTSRRITFEDGSQNLSMSSVCEKSVEDSGITLQEILMEAYRSIGEPDSLYGCGGGKLFDPLTRIRTYEHEALWEKAMSSYDLHSTLPEVTRQVGIVQGLQNLGLCGVLNVYLQGLERQGAEWTPELRELCFQAAWRSTRWDTDLAPRGEKLSPGFNECTFTALQALRDKDFCVLEHTLTYARQSCVEELCRGSLEVLSSLYPTLRNLQMVEELQSVKQLFSGPVTDSVLEEVYRKWNHQLDLLKDSDFSLVEPVLALRSSVQETLLMSETNPDRRLRLNSAYTSHLMELCRLARSAGNAQLAERAVFQVRQQGPADSGTAVHWAWQLEEAQVFWEKKEPTLALGLLKHMIQRLEELVNLNPVVVPVYAECLRLCGCWLDETCRESPAVILETCLEKAVEVLVGQAGVSEPKLQGQKTQAFLSLARFSDAQYQSIENYMSSSEFENKRALLDKAKEEVELMKEKRVHSNRYTVKVQRELELDQRALATLQTDRRRFLLKAVENYARCLELGQQHDSWVFRLTSLWLENADDADVNALVQRGVRKIPSYKFLPLMYQLAARMGTRVSSPVREEDVGFQSVLTELICRSSMDHPHHTLFIIFALVNANKDENFSRSRLSKSSSRQPSPLDLERAAVARTIISRVGQDKAALIWGMETLCSAYITLAYMDASRYKTEKKAIPIPADQPIMQIKDIEAVTIPTMEIRVDPSGTYEDVVTVRCFSPNFHLAGGVNLPKIIDCMGSDGRSRRQLVKGQDDLRQDAVMQQVFHMCSSLLQRNGETRKRKLYIRRYKVVPFSQRSGVLEWCSGTMPIGEFLVDTQKGAHNRFRPQDWSNLTCRKKMMEAQSLDSDGKLQVFSELCQNFRPVFRYFCMERFRDAAVWMEKRLAYTRSVATSSIVGYIVGLGDRHIQNILIDEQTAELVHIDLGVAFEQGRILPTPETVPFRLSRDIVDGMGISGVEGVFRRCCEKTMEVMRNSQEVLLTIVEVLLYDPLFDWTMNPLKAFYLQQQDEQPELNATLNPTLEHRTRDSQSFNKVAERVLLRLQEKLKGVEEGAVLSVDGQVNLLIQQAMDPKNLSRLFHGWQAWV